MKVQVVRELKINKIFNELVGLKKSYERLQLLGVCRTHIDNKYFVFLQKEIPRLEKELEQLNNPKPPCPHGGKKDCKWLQKYRGQKNQSNALRIETIAPIDRCGYLIKENCMGGYFFHYEYCIK